MSKNSKFFIFKYVFARWTAEFSGRDAKHGQISDPTQNEDGCGMEKEAFGFKKMMPLLEDFPQVCPGS